MSIGRAIGEPGLLNVISSFDSIDELALTTCAMISGVNDLDIPSACQSTFLAESVDASLDGPASGN